MTTSYNRQCSITGVGLFVQHTYMRTYEYLIYIYRERERVTLMDPFYVGIWHLVNKLYMIFG